MMAQKLRFSRGLKAKVPRAVPARVPAPTPLVEIFTGSAPIDWTQEATTVKVRVFLPSRVFQKYDSYFTNVLNQRSCFEVLLTAGSLCFTRDDARTFVPTIPRRRRVSWNTEVFVHSNSAVIVNESHQTYSSYQLVASGNIHNAVSRQLDKNCAKHRRTVFSMNKAQESKQRSTNWRRRHLGDMQQQPRRWPDYDKSEETKLR